MDEKFVYKYYGEYNDTTGSMLITVDDLYNILNRVVPKLFLRIEEKITERELRIFVPSKLVDNVWSIAQDISADVFRRVGITLGSSNLEFWGSVKVLVLPDTRAEKRMLQEDNIPEDFRYHDPKIEHLEKSLMLRTLSIVKERFLNNGGNNGRK